MFFDKKENNTKNLSLMKIAALLIHAAKIDEEYTDEEDKIIKETLIDLGANEKELNILMINAKKKRGRVQSNT